VPLDEALSRVVIDLSGRPGLEFHVPFTRALIGAFDVDLAHEFFQGFVNHALVTLHVDNLRGDNEHHHAETVFKAFRARALRMALAPDPRAGAAIPSTRERFDGVDVVSGIGYQVSGIGYRVSGIRYQVSGIRHQASGIRHQAWASELP
jgi:hypothetical protein